MRPRKKAVEPRPVQTALVIKKDAPVYIDSFGTLTPINDVNIQAQITGKVLQVNFKEGDDVSEGDALFLIDPSEYEAQLKESEATLLKSRADLKLKQDTLERNRTLLAKELISQQDFEEYQTNVSTAEATVKLNEASVDLARINLGYCYVKAPIDGVTGKRLVDPGNIVTANTGPTLVNIKSVDPFYIDFTISEKELPRVRDAMKKETLKVKISPTGDDSGPYEGNLIFIDNTVDDLTGTVALRALVSNKERKLWAGQFVLVRVILSIAKNATLAPYQAVSIGQDGPYLFVVTKDNKADLRLLTLGEREGDYLVVTKGVTPKERVVTIGRLGLAPGMPVKDTAKDQAEKGKKK